MKFSERYGHVPVRSILQTSDIDEGLKNRLWNVICSTFFASVPSSNLLRSNALRTHHPNETLLFYALWHDHLKRTTDTIGDSYIHALQSLRDVFFSLKRYRLYDLIQFFAESKAVPPDKQRPFIQAVNSVLKEEGAGYRFISDQIVQITSEEEIAAIEQALAAPDSLKPVREHLSRSLTLLADKKDPDYRNSIKESISAVESLSKLIAKLPKTTLGPALAALEKKTTLHPSLKEAFHKLYGYTSDAQGIRHALMDEPNLDIEDAKFMLVSCSAFVNYLVVKAQKAGIAL
jgi:hypothetical protein